MREGANDREEIERRIFAAGELERETRRWRIETDEALVRAATETYKQHGIAPYTLIHRRVERKSFFSKEGVTRQYRVGRVFPIAHLGRVGVGINDADYHHVSKYLYYDVQNDRLVGALEPSGREVILTSEATNLAALQEFGTGLQDEVDPRDIPERMAEKAYQLIARTISRSEEGE